MTSAPDGIGTFGPTSRIRWPSVTMIWLVAAVPVSGSIRRPALMAVVFCGPDGCPPRPWACRPGLARLSRAVATMTRFSMSASPPVFARLTRSLRPVQGEPSGEPSEVEPESELLAAFGTLGERKAEGRRLQAALVPQPVVHVEYVEHLPERRRRVLAAEPEDLADTKVGALVDGGALRIARLGPVGERIRIELDTGGDAVRQRAPVRCDTGELHVNLPHEVRRVDDEIVPPVVVVRTQVFVEIERVGRPTSAQTGGRVRSRLRERVRKPGARVRRRTIFNARFETVVPDGPAVADQRDVGVARIPSRVRAVGILDPVRVGTDAGVTCLGVHVVGAGAQRGAELVRHPDGEVRRVRDLVVRLNAEDRLARKRQAAQVGIPGKA